MRPPPVIRDATLDDAPALVSLLEELGYPTTADVLAERMRAFAAAGERALVAAVDGEVLGLITLHATPVLHRPTAVGRLTTLVVAARARGTGVGRALVAAAEQLLAERGCALVEVTSNRKRRDAHAFYEHLGYCETSLRFYKPLVPPGEARA